MGPEKGTMRTRFWVETAFAAATGVLFLLTLCWRAWLEWFGVDLDNHSGMAEWLIVAGLVALFVAFGVSGRLELRKNALVEVG
jgi:hypothetical protein